jgi:hypothetical protein
MRYTKPLLASSLNAPNAPGPSILLVRVIYAALILLAIHPFHARPAHINTTTNQAMLSSFVPWVSLCTCVLHTTFVASAMVNS